MKAEQPFKFPCWFPFSGHEWSEWTYPSCYRTRTCIKCQENERESNWHRLGNWSAQYGVKVFDSAGRTVEQQRQKRICSDCNMIEERVVGW